MSFAVKKMRKMTGDQVAEVWEKVLDELDAYREARKRFKRSGYWDLSQFEEAFSEVDEAAKETNNACKGIEVEA